MAHKDNHPIARKMVAAAEERWSDVEHEYASTPEKLMDAIIIVNGAMWATIEDRRNGYVVITISKRALGVIATGVTGGTAVVVGYMKQWF